MKHAAAGHRHGHADHDSNEKKHLGTEWANEDLSIHEAELDESAGLFFRFTTGALFLLSAILFFVLYLIAPRLSEIHHRTPEFLTYASAIFIIFASLGLFLTYITVTTGKRLLPDFLTKGGKDKTLIILITPLAVKLGGFFGVSRDRIASSFIKVNNALVMAAGKRGKNNSVLILLPRCIQHSKCKQKVEIDITNCKDCGLCDIADIIRICEENKIESFVATGGNLARALIKEKRPSGVIGVACERELLSGIHDTSGLPVIGIPNSRPEGPCIDTRVDLEKLDKAVKSFLK
ncbi:MAG: DUF116 domain-containing protein [Deltaproteobacteria bacterium]|nr:DUF116 domain-containing protein [Deltaproteobacteria bacterium]